MRRDNRSTFVPLEPLHDEGADLLRVLDFRYYLAVIRERWLLSAVSTAIGCALLAWFLASQPPVYSSKALLMVDRSADRVVDVPEVVPSGLGEGWAAGDQAHILIQTHIAEMTSRRFAEYVLEQLSPGQVEALADIGAAGRWHPRVWLARLPPPAEEPDLAERALAALEKDLRVRRLDDTLMIEVRYNHRMSDIAAAVANAFVYHYVEHVVDRSTGRHVQAATFLKHQVNDLRRTIEELQADGHAYREKHNLIATDEDVDLSTQQVAEIRAALTRARLERIGLNLRLRQVEEKISQGAGPRELLTFPGFAFLQDASDELDALERERKVLSARYLDHHPRMRENAQAIEALKTDIGENLAAALQDLRNQHEVARSEEQELEQELAETERQALELARHAAHYQMVRSETDLSRSSYGHIVNRLQETAMAAELAGTNLRIAETAIPSRRPVSPRLARIGLMVAFFGGILFFALPLGLNAIDPRLRRAGDVESFLQRPLIGEIPLAQIEDSTRKVPCLQPDGDDPLQEGLRAIYSSLSALGKANGVEQECQTIALAGTLPNEGKTFIASNLACTCASHGKRTLLIDCDLRGLGIARLLGLSGSKGIEAYLQQHRAGKNTALTLSLLLQEISDDLFVLPAFGPRGATELLEKGGFASLIEECRNQFDIIILDTPPLKLFPDLLQLARHVDWMLYLCEFGRVDRDLLKEMIRRVERVHQKPIGGVILNKMPIRHGSLYRYTASGYYGDPERKQYCAARKAG